MMSQKDRVMWTKGGSLPFHTFTQQILLTFTLSVSSKQGSRH